MAYLLYDFLYGSSNSQVLQTLFDIHHATKINSITLDILKFWTHFAYIRFLPCVDSHVSNQLVLGIEWFHSPSTSIPHTGELLTALLVLFMIVLDVVHQCISLHELLATVPPPTSDDPTLTGFFTRLLLNEGCIVSAVPIVYSLPWWSYQEYLCHTLIDQDQEWELELEWT